MFKIIAIAVISLYFLFELLLSILRYANRNSGVPSELKDVYDEERYLKWKRYSAEKIKVEIVSNAVNTAIILALIITNVFHLISKHVENEYVSTILVLGSFIILDALINLPFRYITDLKIESKYGFNKSSMKTFVSDQMKKFLISFILILGLTLLFILLYNTLHDYVILLFTGILFVIVLIVSFLYPLFSKAFNKFNSLEEGELRTSLINMLTSHGYQVRDIKIMDASRRTTKSNAYFTGFGKMKTIVLYDNILNVMSEREIIAIFAHEMGHGLHKDTLKNSILSFINIAIIVVLAWLLIKFPEIYQDFGFAAVNYGFAVILLVSVVLPFVSTLIGFISNYVSRRAEYKADEQAFKEGYADDLISALKTLYREDLGDLNPLKLIVLLSYSHPTLLQRIKHIEELKQNQ